MRRIWGRVVGWVDSRAHTAAYSTLVTLAIIVVGALGSLFSPEIRGAFPFPGECSSSFPFCWKKEVQPAALLWWMAASLTALFFFRREVVIFRRAEQSQERLETKSGELAEATDAVSNRVTGLAAATLRIEEQGTALVTRADAIDARARRLSRLIRTLPPENYLGDFTVAYSRCHQVLVDALTGPDAADPEYLRASIKTVLQWILTLAQSFDRRLNDDSYSANLMIFHPADPHGRNPVLPRFAVPFQHFRFDPTDLEGYLVLRAEFATSAGAPSAELEIREIALPVLRGYETADRNRIRVLPGAPLAFASEQLFGVSDTNELGNWCRHHGDFTESLAQEIEAYFRSRPYRSFVSIPLQPFDQAIRPVGIINIQSRARGPLLEKLPAKQFLPLLDPFVRVLLRLLQLLDPVDPDLKLTLVSAVRRDDDGIDNASTPMQSSGTSFNHDGSEDEQGAAGA